jgi:hypothetical protein
MAMNMEIFNIFYGNMNDEMFIKQAIIEKLDTEKDIEILKAIEQGRSLRDPEIINKVYSTMANLITKEVIETPISRVATQELPDAESKLLGLRKAVDYKEKLQLIKAYQGIEGNKVDARKYNYWTVNKEEASSYAKGKGMIREKEISLIDMQKAKEFS